MSHALRKILPLAATAAGYYFGGPLGAAAASGVTNYSQNHNLGQAALAAGGSYVGSNIGGNLVGDVGGTVGNAVNSAFGETAGNVIGPSLGSSIIGQNLGRVAGNFIGGTIGSDLASNLIGSKNKNPTGESAAPAFKPTREAQQETPLSLKGLGSLTPDQYSSNVATGGVYGGGAGPDEQSYFENLINRRLVDDAGHVSSDLSGINPIENSYLSQIGLGGNSNATSLLEAISKRRKAA